MSHTYTRQLLHVVFSTKERRPHLTPDKRPRMFGYLRAVSDDLGVALKAVWTSANGDTTKTWSFTFESTTEPE